MAASQKEISDHPSANSVASPTDPKVGWLTTIGIEVPLLTFVGVLSPQVKKHDIERKMRVYGKLLYVLSATGRDEKM